MGNIMTTSTIESLSIPDGYSYSRPLGFILAVVVVSDFAAQLGEVSENGADLSEFGATEKLHLIAVSASILNFVLQAKEINELCIPTEDSPTRLNMEQLQLLFSTALYVESEMDSKIGELLRKMAEGKEFTNEHVNSILKQSEYGQILLREIAAINTESEN
jgi:hypothetical protein